MWTAAVAFGQRVAVLDPRGPAPTVPLHLLTPGDGTDLRRRAATARHRSEAIGDLRHREVLVPGRPSYAQRVRVDMLGADPQEVDADARLRLFPTDRADVQRYEVLGRWGAWRHRIGGLLDTVAEPGQGADPAQLRVGEWAAVLADRPHLRDAPTGPGIPRGLGSWRAQALLDSLVARATLIAALQGEQYADAALLAETYPENQEFLTAEVSIALQVPESDASSLVCTGTHLASRLPATLAACRAGQITAEAAQVILGATAVLTDTDPSITEAVEAAVLPHTRWKTRESLRRRVVREVIRHDPDGADQRHTGAKKKRCVSKWSDVDGMGWLKLYATAQEIAAVWEAITALAQAAKTPGCDTTLGQRRADAMCDVFQQILADGGFSGTDLPAQHGRRPHISVLIPADLLQPDATAPTGTADPNTVAGPDTDARHPDCRCRPADPPGTDPPPGRGRGVAEIAGYGPIAPNQALQLAARGLWRRLVCDPLSGQLLDYGRTRYEPPPALKQFVVTRDQQCRYPGCTQPAWRSQIDHAQPYSAGGCTDEANLHCLCHHHHRAKDGGGFRLTINPDRSTTWTTPLGRSVTIAPEPLMDPAPLTPAAPAHIQRTELPLDPPF